MAVVSSFLLLYALLYLPLSAGASSCTDQLPINQVTLKPPPGEYNGTDTTPMGCFSDSNLLSCGGGGLLGDGDPGTVDLDISTVFAWSETVDIVFSLIPNDRVQRINLFFHNEPQVGVGLPSLIELHRSVGNLVVPDNPLDYTILDNQDLSQSDERLRNVTLVVTTSDVVDHRFIRIHFDLPETSQINTLLLSDVQLCGDSVSVPVENITFLESDEVLQPDAPSLHSLFARILHSGKPLVVHNGWIDLLFLYHTFYSPLPPSLDAFMADLSEMFQGGVFDTKAIAEYKLGEGASFLEYIFRKSQRENSQRCANNGPHLTLHFTSYPHHTESVSVMPPPCRPGVFQLRVCQTFARFGYCHQPDCQRCHDVMVVIEQDEHVMESHSLKRKRARDERKRKQQLKRERSAMERCKRDSELLERSSRMDRDGPPSNMEGGEPDSGLSNMAGGGQNLGPSNMEGDGQDIGPSNMEGDGQDIGPSNMEGDGQDIGPSNMEGDGSSVTVGSKPEDKGSIVEESEAVHMEDLNIQEEAGHVTENLEQSLTTDHNGRNILQVFQKDLDVARARLSTSSSHGYTKKPSFGHRAGFDAFMTGFSFSHFAVKSNNSGSFSQVSLLSGLSDMCNCLGNRGKPFPMRIAKSHFAKTSAGHRKAWKTIKESFGRSQLSEMSTT